MKKELFKKLIGLIQEHEKWEFTKTDCYMQAKRVGNSGHALFVTKYSGGDPEISTELGDIDKELGFFQSCSAYDESCWLLRALDKQNNLALLSSQEVALMKF